MLTLPLRLTPGQDLRAALQAAAAEHAEHAGHAGAGAFVLAGIGSLSIVQLRLAGAGGLTAYRGDIEILTLAGTLTPDGPHLHMSIADADGRVFGGHVGAGCIVRTTAEVLLALLPEHRLGRETDPLSGYSELVVRAPGAGERP